MKHWPFVFGGFATLIIIGVLGFFLFSSKGQSKTTQQSQGELEQVQPPDIDARPFFFFAPRSDGRAIQISISGISEGTKIDYEITYKTGAGLEQGIGGPVALEPGQTFYTREHIFGTCSKNVCTYDKGVENGKWSATITQGNKFFELSGGWRLQNPGTKSASIGLPDKFDLSLETGTLTKSLFLITSENSSLPKKLPEGIKAVFGPFTIASSEQVSLKKPAKVSFNTEKTTNFQILQISTGQTDWKPLETTFDSAGKSATASTSTLGTFILVEKI